MASQKNKSPELTSRDTLIECLLARVQECEEEKLTMEQTQEHLKTDLHKLRETNILLHSTIKKLQVNDIKISPRREEQWEAPIELEVDESFSNYNSEIVELIPLSSSTSSFSSSSSSTDSSPSPYSEDDMLRPTHVTSVDELLAFLVWLFLHIAILIDSHRKFYHQDKL